MADSGWVSGTVATLHGGSGDRCDGYTGWTNASNAESQSDTYATCAPGKFKFTDCLSATAFSFGIPSGATIDGIEVRYDGYATLLLEAVVALILDGVYSVGDNKGLDAQVPTSDTDTYREFGGSADMWNSGYDYDDITDSGFGFVMSFSTGDPGYTMYVDHLQVKITYTPAAGYGNDVNDVPSANIASINDVLVENIETVNEV